jgi:hypothetical protein
VNRILEKFSSCISIMALAVQEAKDLICELCRLFYDQGWVSGTGGGISVKAGDRIVMAPSGVQKERMLASDMFVLDAEGNVVEEPKARPAPYKPPKLSECSPLFMAVSVRAQLTVRALSCKHRILTSSCEHLYADGQRHGPRTHNCLQNAQSLLHKSVIAELACASTGSSVMHHSH